MATLREQMFKAERQAILLTLERLDWHVISTAQVLGLPRRTLYRKLTAHKIRRPPRVKKG